MPLTTPIARYWRGSVTGEIGWSRIAVSGFHWPVTTLASSRDSIQSGLNTPHADCPALTDDRRFEIDG